MKYSFPQRRMAARNRLSGDVVSMMSVQSFQPVHSKIDEDNEELLLEEEITSRDTRGHGKTLRQGRRLNDVEKYSFPPRSMEAWTKLSEDVVSGRSVQSSWPLHSKIDVVDNEELLVK